MIHALIIVALILAAIAIYVFGRPVKPLVIFSHGPLPMSTVERLSISLKHACDAAGIKGVLIDGGGLTAQTCQPSYVVNVDARGLDDSGIKAAVQKSINAMTENMKKAQRR